MAEHTYSNAPPYQAPTLDGIVRVRTAIDALDPPPRFTGRIFVEESLPKTILGVTFHWEVDEAGDVRVSRAMHWDLVRLLPTVTADA